MAADDFAARKAPDDLKSVEYARQDGSIRTMHAREGLLHPQDGQDDAALEAAGFAQDSDSLKALEAKQAEAAEKEREAADKAAEKQEAAEEKAEERAAAAAEKAADQAKEGAS